MLNVNNTEINCSSIESGEKPLEPALVVSEGVIKGGFGIEPAQIVLTIVHFMSGIPMFRLPFLAARTRPYFQWRPMAT